MKDLIEIVSAWRSLPPAEEAILATVVVSSGSTYRKVGARMLLDRAGKQTGSISGGCLESDLIGSAWTRTENGPAIVTYDSTSSEDIVWGFGLGCNGVVKLLLERITSGDASLAFLEQRLLRRDAGVLATVISEGPGLARRGFLVEPETDTSTELKRVGKSVLDDLRSRIEHIGDDIVLFEAVQPPLNLALFGGGFDAGPLVEIAKQMGWFVTVTDHRESHARPTRFPTADQVILLDRPENCGLKMDGHTAAVVMSHNYLRDLETLRWLMRTDVGYIGMLGPRRRTEQMLRELRAEPSDAVHAPVGLDIGADGPHEIALSVVAEIVAFIAKRPGMSLRLRDGSIHTPELFECSALS